MKKIIEMPNILFYAGSLFLYITVIAFSLHINSSGAHIPSLIMLAIAINMIGFTMVYFVKEYNKQKKLLNV